MKLIPGCSSRRVLQKVGNLPFHMYQLAEPGDTLVQGPEMYTARVLDLPFIIIFVPRFTLSDHILGQQVSRRFAFSWEVCVYCLVSFSVSPLFSTTPTSLRLSSYHTFASTSSSVRLSQLAPFEVTSIPSLVSDTLSLVYWGP